MPYIPQERRLDGAALQPLNAGELNYAFTRLIVAYVKRQGRCYQTFNDVLGALDGAGNEFLRRVVNPYESVKCRDNGDVYE